MQGIIGSIFEHTIQLIFSKKIPNKQNRVDVEQFKGQICTWP